jgi:hypothetical protein
MRRMRWNGQLRLGGPDILIPATVTVKSPAVTPW